MLFLRSYSVNCDQGALGVGGGVGQVACAGVGPIEYFFCFFNFHIDASVAHGMTKIIMPVGSV